MHGTGRQIVMIYLSTKNTRLCYNAAMTTAVKKELKKLARESFREVLQEELMKQRGLSVLAVSEKEQRGINKLYKKPSGRAVRATHVRI